MRRGLAERKWSCTCFTARIHGIQSLLLLLGAGYRMPPFFRHSSRFLFFAFLWFQEAFSASHTSAEQSNEMMRCILMFSTHYCSGETYVVRSPALQLRRRELEACHATCLLCPGLAETRHWRKGLRCIESKHASDCGVSHLHKWEKVVFWVPHNSAQGVKWDSLLHVGMHAGRTKGTFASKSKHALTKVCRNMLSSFSRLPVQ